MKDRTLILLLAGMCALLGIDFMLELQECLKVSCVPEEWQWQKWEPERADE